MEDLKNNIANITTIAGTGSVVIGVSEVLTIALLITGIFLFSASKSSGLSFETAAE